MRFTEAQWAQVNALDEIAEELADYCAREINRRAIPTGTDPIKYAAQHTLEKLIEKLEKKV